MTWEQLQRRDLHWEVLKAGLGVQVADKVVGLLLGPWRPLEGVWQERDGADGTTFEVWDREMNDDE